MKRDHGTDKNGNSFSTKTRDEVWEKGNIILGEDSEKVRRDCCGALIKKAKYGDTGSNNGWEIDHKKPVSKGGTDDLSNLQPLQWENNRHKSDDYPNWDCHITD